ncbi:PHP domain-containing protein [Eggerthella guodeyinii]|uniref:PHP domain-containing protein n=1 Tax=Eggerthella guodeyinii TaxID=2690837 RepID=A0A6N7RMR3_9ACTN|nr:PHP domain-containing protein [Eggerthella guodeyinii]MRX82332.1 PHP domain-containing protein [Eggerthella guodeyinii]
MGDGINGARAARSEGGPAQSGGFKTEFHIHTRYSHDSMMGKRALLFMCKARGVDCVAITDHNEVAGAIAYAPFLEAHGVRVIVGEEVFTCEGEIVGLFLEKRVKPGLTPEETIRRIREQGGVVYIPHPYDEKRAKSVLSRSAIHRNASLIDCVEIHNGRNAKAGFSHVQARIASEEGLSPIIGCDAHCFFEIGRNVCVSDAPFTRKRFNETLASSRFEPSDCMRAAHGVTALVRLTKMLFEGRFDEIHRILRGKLVG